MDTLNTYAVSILEQEKFLPGFRLY